MTYYEELVKLEARKCKTCHGTGKCDDAGLGDIFYNEWECPNCHGAGLIPEEVPCD